MIYTPKFVFIILEWLCFMKSHESGKKILLLIFIGKNYYYLLFVIESECRDQAQTKCI